ncbi:MAG: metal ABC transporter solute-binding protein, Zn/Mn family [Acidimicrobiales bacterium]
MTLPSAALRGLTAIVIALVSALTVASVAQSAAAAGRVIRAVGAENQYADVIAQVGGRYVSVSSILSNPNTDPHTFESSPSVAGEIAAAQLVVQNGVGYDDFMNKIESASPDRSRRVITVQQLLKLPDSTPNPHLWYKPTTMPAVAGAVARDLTSILPARAAYFHANLRRFDRSLEPWDHAIARFKAAHAGVPVATTEPVADYLLEAVGADDLTPFRLQADIMNGLDPSPEDISTQTQLFADHKVKVFVYNEQVVDSLTASFRAAAQKAGIAMVGVYETMPEPGYDYQRWMSAELSALERAVVDRTSTEKL